MSKTNPQRFNSHATRGNASQTIARFVDSVEDLAVELDAPDRVISEFVDAGKEMAELVEENAENVAANREQIEDNEAGIEDNSDEIDEVQERSARERAELSGRIWEVEEKVDEIDSDDGNVDADTRGVEPDELASTTPETPLETVIAMDDATATTELTANTKRARFVAKDIEEYARSVPAGYALKSGEVSTILKSGTNCRGSTKTVARVMEFLADLGNDEVEIVQKRGVNRVILSDEIVERISEIEADDEVVMATTSRVVV